MKVRRLPRDPGPAAWNALLPAPDPAVVLESAATADYLIIGAGFAGLAAARRLGQLCPGAEIVVLDAVRVGEGPAGRNSGFMIDLPHDLNSDGYAGAASADRRQITLNRAAIDFAREAAEEYGLVEGIFQPCGKHNGAATAKGKKLLHGYAAHLKAIGEEFELLDGPAMQTLTGTDFYRAGLFTPGTAMIQPAAYIRGVAEGLSTQVDIRELSPVLSITREGPDHVLECPDGRVTSPRIILAVNGHAQSFGLYSNRFMHVFTYASMTRELDQDEIDRLGGAESWGLIPAEPMGTTVRRLAENRIIIRNRFTLDQSMEVSDARVARMGRDHDTSFANRFPMLEGVEMEYRWGGRLCLSLNSTPAFGEIEEGVFSANCQNGLGTVKGTLAGMMAAELAAGGNSPLLADMLAFDAPKRLPPDWMLSIGANAKIRWDELRAGIEL